MVADHLSRLVFDENPDLQPINDFFPDSSFLLCRNYIGSLILLIILSQVKFHQIGVLKTERSFLWRYTVSFGMTRICLNTVQTKFIGDVCLIMKCMM